VGLIYLLILSFFIVVSNPHILGLSFTHPCWAR
jgi:hypothetical protein